MSAIREQPKQCAIFSTENTLKYVDIGSLIFDSLQYFELCFIVTAAVDVMQ